jgi:hypothetical protein
MNLRKVWDDASVEALPPSGRMDPPFSGLMAARRRKARGALGGGSAYYIDSRQDEQLADSGILPHWLSDSRSLVVFAFAVTS